MEKEEKLKQIRHSLAHLLASAVVEQYPDVKLAIGPAIENGFYYDFEFPEKAPSAAQLDAIRLRMKDLIKENLSFKRVESTARDARAQFANQPYKLELIDELEQNGEPVSLYQTGEFTDLCRGGHVENTREINPDAFALDRIAGAYWRGNENNPMLTRIYGAAFETREELEAHQKRQEEARARDHKKLGRELDLFYIDEYVGKGLPLWTPKGTAIKHELEQFTRALERAYGYDHVETPYLGSKALYEQSGHLAHYSENMYAPIDMDGEIFYLRPMACPHHVRLLMRKPITYRDLPVRYAEIADYNRYEKSGELMGMIRVRTFQLTDAHVFVAAEGLKEEFKNVCSLIQDGMRGLGLSETVSYRFSKRDPHNPDKYHPDGALWEHAERTMKEALDELGFSYVEAEDEAAFYGPKLDVQARNVNGKEDTLFTAQIDFVLPEKFNIVYTDRDGSKKRPVMIHRSAIGSLERTFAFLIEHYAGAFPLWMAPEQVRVLPIGERHREYGNEIFGLLRKSGLRATIDTSEQTLGKKIVNVKNDKVPYYLVIGDDEMSKKQFALERRDGEKLTPKDIDALTAHLLEEIRTRAV